MTLNNYLKSSLIGAAIVGGAAMVYSLAQPKTYLSKAVVTILRPELNDPNLTSQESQNRWIWLRDGLSAKSHLISDDFLKKFILQHNDKAKPENDLSKEIEKMRKNVQLDFTGADSFTFHVTVKNSDKKLAEMLAGSIVNELRTNIIDRPIGNLKSAIAKLEQASKSDNLYNQELLKRLNTKLVLNEVEKSGRFILVKKPSPGSRASLSSQLSIGLAALIFGLFLGFGAQYVRED